MLCGKSIRYCIRDRLPDPLLNFDQILWLVNYPSFILMRVHAPYSVIRRPMRQLLGTT